MSKQIRHRKIKEILLSSTVTNQHELILLLEKRGIDVAQATLSRDCSELGVLRSRTASGYRLMIPEDNPGQMIKGLVEMEIQSIESNESSIVIKTLPGRAHGVGSFIDHLKNPGILGTIAGDDTVLVIPSSVHDIRSILDYMQTNLLNN
ncbi:MAG: arginine repressor [Chlorobium phaeobacteroides]|uniref:Arginine repressor n=1 Tax=Chlorobium phaeobacteroides (strain BS1) TaxID=331678 RepID=ARGR_CHLPB|nr:RecName: Full=Arginine repressor [Chlorobium phaeobacteroides BS1]MBL6956999.1 arginine repressor [Chlorobium phaeobacteroides]NEX13137.1 arginine repressor [Prosthecochloris sp.]